MSKTARLPVRHCLIFWTFCLRVACFVSNSMTQMLCLCLHGRNLSRCCNVTVYSTICLHEPLLNIFYIHSPNFPCLPAVKTFLTLKLLSQYLSWTHMISTLWDTHLENRNALICSLNIISITNKCALLLLLVKAALPVAVHPAPILGSASWETVCLANCWGWYNTYTLCGANAILIQNTQSLEPLYCILIEGIWRLLVLYLYTK